MISSNCTIGFGNDKESANIVYNTVIVDEELSTKVQRDIKLEQSLDGNHLLKMYVNNNCSNCWILNYL